MQFEYLQTVTAQESIEVEDLGNCCLQCFTAYGETKVMIIRTIDGISEIINFGYVNVDMAELPDFVSYTYNRMEFSMHKIAKMITKFINDKDVSQVLEVSLEEARGVIRNLVDCITSRPSDGVDYDRLV